MVPVDLWELRSRCSHVYGRRQSRNREAIRMVVVEGIVVVISIAVTFANLVWVIFYGK
jgi:hypothetical protein